MWEWDCTAPGRSGAGVCHDEDRALSAAGAWMLEHQGAAAPVALDAMGESYVPAGRPVEATVDGEDRITWRPAPP